MAKKRQKLTEEQIGNMLRLLAVLQGRNDVSARAVCENIERDLKSGYLGTPKESEREKELKKKITKLRKTIKELKSKVI